MAAPRPLYRHGELRRLLHPRSIAIVGASAREGSFGLRTLNNLAEFEGAVYPVNARYERIGEHRCYPSIAALPEVPDCAVIALGREAVEQSVAECIAAGVGGVVIYASGYAETQRADLVAMQSRLTALVEGTGTRLIGPNCLGITNYACKARVLFGRMPVSRPLSAHAIAIIAQSGSVSMSLGQVVERGVSVSHALPVGNAADVGLADLIAYLAEDESCRAIACIFEGVADPDRLIAAAELAFAADKPLVVYKMAVGEQGAAAALSHTGALAGSAAAYRAVLQNAGAIMVDRMEDIVETAAFFAKAGRPTGRGAAVVLGSGGLGVIAADMAEKNNLPLEQPAGRTRAILEANVPEFGAPRNPCDVTAMALRDEGPMQICGDALMADPAYSTLVVVHPYADAISSARVKLWLRLAERHGKPICNYWSTEWLEGYGSAEVEGEPRIATFRSLDRMFAALAAWHAREALRRSGREPPRRLVAEAEREAVAALLAQGTGRTLTERQAKSALARYGVPVVEERLVGTIEEAIKAADAIGYPVALKIESPDLPHKTEAGVVRLNLRDGADVRAAYAAISANAERVTPPPRINGVLVQPMVPAGIEMMVGARTDPVFGPLLVVGLGGIMVELLKDTAVARPPIALPQAHAMLRSLKGSAALSGFRGIPPVDLNRLAEVICRLSEFIGDHAGRIAEMDVNPLICAGPRIVAVDALIVRH